MSPRFVASSVTCFVASVPLVAWAVDVGVALTLAHMLGLFLIGVAGLVWTSRRPPLPRDSATYALLAFLFVAAASVVVAQRAPDLTLFDETAHTKSIKQLVGLGFGIGVFFALRCLLAWFGVGLLALRVHFWMTAIFALLTFVQFGIASWDMDSPLANLPVYNSTQGATRPLSLYYGFPRVSVTLVEPSFLATYLLTGWALWLFTVDRPLKHAGARRTFNIAGVLIGAAIVITGSRLAYIVVATLLAAALLVRPMRGRRLALVGVSLLVGLLAAGPEQGRRLVASLFPDTTTPESIAATQPTEPGVTDANPTSGAGAGPPVGELSGQLEAVAETLDISVQQRAASYLVGLQVLRARPMLGSGFGTSAFYMAQLWPERFIPLSKGPNVAPTMLSFYSTIASETGLSGIACVLVLTWGVVSRLRRLAAGGTEGATLAWGLAGALGAYAISGLGSPLVVYQVLTLWLLLAVTLTAAPAPDGEAPDPAPARAPSPVVRG